MGSTFGELALINDESRKASVQCVTDCEFAVLMKEQYLAILDRSEKRHIFMQHFEKVKVLKGLDYLQLKNLYDLSYEQKFKIGNTVYRQGDDSRYVYLIKSGDFEVQRTPMSQDTPSSFQHAAQSSRQREKRKIPRTGEQDAKNDLALLLRTSLANSNRSLNFFSRYEQLSSLQGDQSASRSRASKQAQKIGILSEGECFGLEEFFENGELTFQKRRDCTIICVSEVGTVYKIDRSDLYRRMEFDEGMKRHFASFAEARQKLMRDKLEKADE